jgi:hypothetical protein
MSKPGVDFPDEKEKDLANPGKVPVDLDACPRCGELLDTIRWGQTNCSRRGLHFECC